MLWYVFPRHLSWWLFRFFPIWVQREDIFHKFSWGKKMQTLQGHSVLVSRQVDLWLFFLVLWLWPAHFILVSFLNFANLIFFFNYNFRRDGKFWCPKEGLATNGCNTAFNYYKYSGCSNKCYYLFCHSVGAILNYWHVNNSQAAHIH